MRDFCLQVLSLDKSLGFASIVTADGKVLAAQYRQGENPLLAPEESQLYTMQAVIRMNSRRTLEDRLGRPIFSLTEYERALGATILINENREEGIEESILTVSIDKDCPDPWFLMTKKILPLIRHAFS